MSSDDDDEEAETKDVAELFMKDRIDELELLARQNDWLKYILRV